MNLKAIIAALLLSSTIFASSYALAESDLTPEQLTKARETAARMKPPVNLDELLLEADRLSADCTGDLSRKVIMKICVGNVEIAQSKERQAILDEENTRLDTENARLDEEAIKMINELSDKAEQKLKQSQ